MANKAAKKVKSRSLRAEVWRRLRRNRGAMLGLVIIIVMVAVACSVDLIFDYETDVVEQHLREKLQKPSAEHWFGTDELGRDIFARVVYGSRYSLFIGIASVAFSSLVGIVLGALAGFFGGKLDNLIMRSLDIIGAIPSLLLGMVIVSVLGTGLWNLVLALSVGGICNRARVTRAAVMTVRNSEFVESARSIGMPEWRIILTYILPNCISPILVSMSLAIGGIIISASSLSFLGMGIKEPAPEWGTLLSAGRNLIRGYPYITLFPGLAIMITVLAFNMFGDGLRDAMDPKLRR